MYNKCNVPGTSSGCLVFSFLLYYFYFYNQFFIKQLYHFAYTRNLFILLIYIPKKPPNL